MTWNEYSQSLYVMLEAGSLAFVPIVIERPTSVQVSLADYAALSAEYAYSVSQEANEAPKTWEECYAALEEAYFQWAANPIPKTFSAPDGTTITYSDDLTLRKAMEFAQSKIEGDTKTYGRVNVRVKRRYL